MNSNATVAIETPVENTNEITLNNVVKQGTIMGPILCTAETDKINKILELCYVIHAPEIRINNHLCVDDIATVGNPIVNKRWLKLKVLEEKFFL